MDYEGKCSKEADCNTAMGLHCINSICQCSQLPGQKEEYLFELGSCMNSSMRIMYQDVMTLINRTEFELMRFTTLFNVYMIQATSTSGLQDSNNDLDSLVLPSDINPVVYERLQQLEQHLFAEQSPIPAIVPAPTSPPSSTSAQPDTRAQLEAPQTTVPVVTIPNLLDGLFTRNETPNDATIVPPSPESPPPASPILPNPFQFPSTGNPNLNGDGLTSIIPNFIRMFAQFLPFVQSFNNVLTTAILRPFQRNQQQQQQQPARPFLGGLFNSLSTPILPQIPGGGVDQGGVNVNQDRVRANLLSLPFRLLQVPGRIFNSLFGPNSALAQLRQRLLPNVDFEQRAFRFLPWPLG